MKFRSRLVHMGNQQVKITEELSLDGIWHVVGREEVEARQEALRRIQDENINAVRTLLAVKPIAGHNDKKDAA